MGWLGSVVAWGPVRGPYDSSTEAERGPYGISTGSVRIPESYGVTYGIIRDVPCGVRTG